MRRLVCLLGLLVAAANLPASGPAWWTARGVIAPGATADDYAVANLGQLKHFAAKAADELNANLPSGAGSVINNLVASWSLPVAPGVVRDDYAALNLGQLKAVAALYYDRLIAESIVVSYPWTGVSADDYAVANLGQLKSVFSFVAVAPVGSSDSDGDGLPDAWELTHFGNLAQDGTGDWNGDGISDGDAFAFGFDPKGPDQNHAAGQGDTFTYDARGWLNGFVPAGSATRAFGLDKEGNIQTSN